MIKKDKIIVSWSGGKDSALALYKLKLSAKYEIAGLITTVNAHYRRVSIHGSRVALLRRQKSSLG
jgi:diphthamide synthase (EF-2-diphthine--ammonia ligase)